jgi:hypothetical protein
LITVYYGVNYKLWFYETQYTPPEPCPPVDDPVLADATAVSTLQAALAEARPVLNGTGRHEIGGYIYQRDDGSLFLVRETEGVFTECKSPLKRFPDVPTISGAHFYGYWHVHPNNGGEAYYSDSCKAKVKGQKASAGDRDANGGGSDADWDWTVKNNSPLYIIAQGKLLYRLDAARGLHEDQWEGNPNKWKFDSDRSCVLHR